MDNGLGTVAKARQARCFHRRTRCEFCRFPAPVVRHRHRCPSCGRFVRGRAAVEACARCAARGFHALRLF